MPCRKPLTGFRNLNPDDNTIIFKSSHPDAGNALNVPCGQCIGCRLEYSRQWAVRCVHESKLHDHNSFVTLSYSPENLPENGSLEKDVIPTFMKRLRAHITYDRVKNGLSITPIKNADGTKSCPWSPRYFYCGEYGDQLSRPHYHICLFNYDPPDKRYLKCVDGNNLYTSQILDDLWDNKGHVWVGSLTFDSAAYVARYVTKKINISQASPDSYLTHYGNKLPEFARMSRKPAIGLNFIKKFHKEIYDHDEVILRGKKMKPSRYYDKFMEKYFPERLEDTKLAREEYAHQLHSVEKDISRQIAKYEHNVLMFNNPQRSLENDPTSLSKDSYDKNAIAFLKTYYKELL